MTITKYDSLFVSEEGEHAACHFAATVKLHFHPHLHPDALPTHKDALSWTRSWLDQAIAGPSGLEDEQLPDDDPPDTKPAPSHEDQSNDLDVLRRAAEICHRYTEDDIDFGNAAGELDWLVTRLEEAT